MPKGLTARMLAATENKRVATLGRGSCALARVLLARQGGSRMRVSVVEPSARRAAALRKQVTRRGRSTAAVADEALLCVQTQAQLQGAGFDVVAIAGYAERAPPLRDLRALLRQGAGSSSSSSGVGDDDDYVDDDDDCRGELFVLDNSLGHGEEAPEHWVSMLRGVLGPELLPQRVGAAWVEATAGAQRCAADAAAAAGDAAAARESMMFERFAHEQLRYSMPGPQSVVFDAICGLPAVSSLGAAEVALLLQEVGASLDAHPDTKHAERVVLPLCTHVYSARALPADGGGGGG